MRWERSISSTSSSAAAAVARSGFHARQIKKSLSTWRVVKTPSTRR
jgi:hypothetical protein